MHHARLSSSPRLKQLLMALQQTDGEMSSRDICDATGTIAPGTAVSELRANDAEIDCRQEVRNGRRLFFYKLIKSPKGL